MAVNDALFFLIILGVVVFAGLGVRAAMEAMAVIQMIVSILASKTVGDLRQTKRSEVNAISWARALQTRSERDCDNETWPSD